MNTGHSADLCCAAECSRQYPLRLCEITESIRIKPGRYIVQCLKQLSPGRTGDKQNIQFSQAVSNTLFMGISS